MAPPALGARFDWNKESVINTVALFIPVSIAPPFPAEELLINWVEVKVAMPPSVVTAPPFPPDLLSFKVEPVITRLLKSRYRAPPLPGALLLLRDELLINRSALPDDLPKLKIAPPKLLAVFLANVELLIAIVVLPPLLSLEMAPP